MNYDINGNGYLNNLDDWNEDFADWAASNDNITLTDEHWKYINSAREMFVEDGVVPPIRVFAKKHGMGRKAKRLYELFPSGVMTMISKYAGLYEPQGIL